MATSGNQDPTGEASKADDPTIEAAAHVEDVVNASAAVGGVAPAGDEDPSNTADAAVIDGEDLNPSAASEGASEAGPAGSADESTVVSKAIPPLLTDTEPLAGSQEKAGVDDAQAAEAGEEPTVLGAPASKERIADAAAAARERVAEGASEARERAAEGASLAKERGAEVAAVAKEKTADAAAQAKVKTAKARKRFSEVASEAKGRASSAASEARERAAQTDVTEFAHSTTSLIDTARPFFLAGCAGLFAILGFLEGDQGTAEVFAIGAVIFVIGAAFSGEINAFLASRSHARDRPEADKPES
jgi:hypothetical protein